VRPVSLPKVATSPSGNHLARGGRLARASALLLMRERIWQSRPSKSNANTRGRGDERAGDPLAAYSRQKFLNRVGDNSV
jgi:hypothetical protein